MNRYFQNFLLETTQASSAREVKVIQSLWSGYGKISRYKLKGGRFKTVIVKHIDLSIALNHPRGWNTIFSHKRKVKSYEVEINWYNHWRFFTSEKCPIPKYIGYHQRESEQWIVMQDLDNDFPVRRQSVDLNEVKVCLKWLAHFHGIFMSKAPDLLWEKGTYWHLDTRPDEWKKMENNLLKEKALAIDKRLNEAKFKTIIHGDAKLANFCFSSDGKSVAALDFQYVGEGCGMKDVAYFLSSCLSGEECGLYEDHLLTYYFEELSISLKSSEIDTIALEKEWRSLYPFAVADFVRFLRGWMPTHQKLNDYNTKLVNQVLASLDS